MKKLLFVLIFNVFMIGFVEAATYHIDPGAGASGNGSASNPYRSWTDLRDAHPSMQTGDDVYFKCGTTLYPSSELRIDWEGEETDRVVIGAYYMNGDTPVYGVSENKPVLSGDNNTIPEPNQKVSYRGLIQIVDQDYITIENLKIDGSRGDGIRFNGDLAESRSCQYFIVDNCDITNNYLAAVRVMECAYNYGVIRNCYVAYNALAGDWNPYKDKDEGIDIHPGIIMLRHCPYANAVIEKNLLFQNYGESILIGAQDDILMAHSGHVTIQDNFDFGKGLSYFAGVEEIEYTRNVVIRGNWSGVDYGGVKFQHAGIGIGNEDHDKDGIGTDTTKNIKIHNNLIASASVAVWLGTQFSSDTMSGIEIFNNTIIGSYRTFRDNTFGNNQKEIAFVNCKLRNNAVYNPDGTVFDPTPTNLAGRPPDEWKVEYNGGTGTPFGDNWISEGSHWIDPLGSDWQTIDDVYEILNILPVYFGILQGSKLKNAGVALDDKYAFDYFDTPRFQGTGWDIGAFEITELVNAGIESGNDGSWSLGNNCRIVNNSSQAHSDSHALRLTADGRWHAARQSVDLVDFHIYEIQGHIRSNNILGQAPRIRLRGMMGVIACC